MRIKISKISKLLVLSMISAPISYVMSEDTPNIDLPGVSQTPGTEPKANQLHVPEKKSLPDVLPSKTLPTPPAQVTEPGLPPQGTKSAPKPSSTPPPPSGYVVDVEPLQKDLKKEEQKLKRAQLPSNALPMTPEDKIKIEKEVAEMKESQKLKGIATDYDSQEQYLKKKLELQQAKPKSLPAEQQELKDKKISRLNEKLAGLKEAQAKNQNFEDYKKDRITEQQKSLDNKIEGMKKKQLAGGLTGIDEDYAKQEKYLDRKLKLQKINQDLLPGEKEKSLRTEQKLKDLKAAKESGLSFDDYKKTRTIEKAATGFKTGDEKRIQLGRSEALTKVTEQNPGKGMKITQDAQRNAARRQELSDKIKEAKSGELPADQHQRRFDLQKAKIDKNTALLDATNPYQSKKAQNEALGKALDSHIKLREASEAIQSRQNKVKAEESKGISGAITRAKNQVQSLGSRAKTGALKTASEIQKGEFLENTATRAETAASKHTKRANKATSRVAKKYYQARANISTRTSKAASSLSKTKVAGRVQSAFGSFIRAGIKRGFRIR